jgi:hypothetical protein
MPANDLDIIPPDMRAELEKFDRVAEQVIAEFVAPIESQEPPSIIFHYTDDAGLKGILESGKFWFTDIFNLNDPSELKHGLSHAVNILKSKVVASRPECKLFTEQFEDFVEKGGIQASAHYFVCSFSSAGDDLGQWRAYADNGRGFAIGFDAKALETAFTKDGCKPIPNNSTFPTTYQDAQLIALLEKTIDAMFALISLPRGRCLAGEVNKAYIVELYVSLSIHALRAVLFFKHEAYNNEKEYRFLQIFKTEPIPEVKFRKRPYSLTRYREFDWRSVAEGSLRQIVIGPAAETEKASQFAKDCLAAFHHGNVEIVRSKVPYRAT